MTHIVKGRGCEVSDIIHEDITRVSEIEYDSNYIPLYTHRCLYHFNSILIYTHGVLHNAITIFGAYSTYSNRQLMLNQATPDIRRKTGTHNGCLCTDSGIDT